MNTEVWAHQMCTFHPAHRISLLWLGLQAVVRPDARWKGGNNLKSYSSCSLSYRVWWMTLNSPGWIKPRAFFNFRLLHSFLSCISSLTFIFPSHSTCCIFLSSLFVIFLLLSLFSYFAPQPLSLLSLGYCFTCFQLLMWKGRVGYSFFSEQRC